MIPFGHSGLSVGAEELEKYTIVMWYGSLATIPAGWTLCDGTLGTPDLRNYFVRGAPAGEAASNVVLGTDSHEHALSLRTATIPQGTGTASAAPAHTHTTDVVAHIPPYKKMVFIMKT